jgi:hypothetical protein
MDGFTANKLAQRTSAYRQTRSLFLMPKRRGLYELRPSAACVVSSAHQALVQYQEYVAFAVAFDQTCKL